MDHKSADREKVKSVSDCRKILSEKILCFNYTGTKYLAAGCRSNQMCLLCKCKHHTLICKKRSYENSELMLATTESSVICPAAVIKVTSIKCRALLNTGSGNSYAFEGIIDLLKINRITK